MIRWLLIISLSIIGAATGYWGYLEHQEKNAILIQAENNYQRAFHDLSYRIDLLHDKIGTTLVMNSREQLTKQLIEVWRLTAEAHSDVGQLPLSLLPFNETVKFLTSIGDFTYRTAIRDLDNEPLTDDELNTLKNLYKQANTIKDQLREVQYLALKNNLRWMDVQLALANEEEPMDNTIIDGFQTVDNHVSGLANDDNFASLVEKDTDQGKYQSINQTALTEGEILSKATSILNSNDAGNLNITKSKEAAEIPMYSITMKNEDKSGYLDLLENGGQLHSLLIHRPIKDKKMSLHEGLEKAKEFVEAEDFQNMELINSSEYDQIGLYQFVYLKDDVRIFPDSIEVKVALDNGEIIGFSAKSFLKNHFERNILQPKLTLDQAKEYVNDNFEIMDAYEAIIENKDKEEILVYEFIGRVSDEVYRICINAETGYEESIDKIKNGETNYNAL